MSSPGGATRIGAWIVGAIVGAAIGVGGFTFLYARGADYLGHDPAACANCHVMQGQYDAWLQGSHRAVAACNDCHAPHALLPKLAVKSINGFRHSLAFTTGVFHEPIQITAMNRSVTEAACRHCHEEIVEAIDGRALACIRCHHGVGHVDFAPLGSPATMNPHAAAGRPRPNEEGTRG